jgi:hypothetical protein
MLIQLRLIFNRGITGIHWMVCWFAVALRTDHSIFYIDTHVVSVFFVCAKFFTFTKFFCHKFNECQKLKKISKKFDRVSIHGPKCERFFFIFLIAKFG